MTIGEKIQFYRKKIGLSQEELGVRLLLSRQTVSLWEMDKTIPTVDNLIRLKEIFGVTVDDILNGEEVKENEINVPRERYEISFSESEIKKLTTLSLANFIRGSMFFSIAFLLAFILSIASDISSFVSGLTFALFIASMLIFYGFIISLKRVIKANVTRISGSTYIYEVYDDRIELDILKNGLKAKHFNIILNNIEAVKCKGNFISFAYEGQGFNIKLDALDEDSYFLSLINNPPRKKQHTSPKGAWLIVSWVIFGLSIASLFIALMITVAMSPDNWIFYDKAWILFLFVPIPFSSIVIGFIMKAKKYKYIKNIIIGFAMTFILCIYGCFTFVFPSSQNEALILKAESTVGVELPDDRKIVYYEPSTQSGDSFIHSRCDVSFSKEVSKEFENEIKQDARWANELTTLERSILPDGYKSTEFSYVLIYNITENTSNNIPSEDGKYSFICLLYGDTGLLRIIEYDLDFKS